MSAHAGFVPPRSRNLLDTKLKSPRFTASALLCSRLAEVNEQELQRLISNRLRDTHQSGTEPFNRIGTPKNVHPEISPSYFAADGNQTRLADQIY